MELSINYEWVWLVQVDSCTATVRDFREAIFHEERSRSSTPSLTADELKLDNRWDAFSDFSPKLGYGQAKL